MLELLEKEELVQEYHSTHKKFEQWQAASETETVDQTLHQQPRYPEGSQVRGDVGSKQKKWDTNQEQHQQQPQSEPTASDTDMGAIYNYSGSIQTR